MCEDVTSASAGAPLKVLEVLRESLLILGELLALNDGLGIPVFGDGILEGLICVNSAECEVGTVDLTRGAVTSSVTSSRLDARVAGGSADVAREDDALVCLVLGGESEGT